jgi:hypothetical protein
MKKTSIALATAAFAGISVFSAAPAFAVGLPFENCTAAANVGVYNIPLGTAGYQPALDRDNDGIGCEANVPYDAAIVDQILADNTVPTPVPPVDTAPPVVVAPPVVAPEQQMGQIPVGGADTGVPMTPQANDAGALALGGGLVVAAFGGAFVVRRRSLATN